MARIAIHPGEHLAEELDGLNMSAAELARRLNVPTIIIEKNERPARRDRYRDLLRVSGAGETGDRVRNDRDRRAFGHLYF